MFGLETDFCSALVNSPVCENEGEELNTAGSWCLRGETSVSRGYREIIYHLTFIWHELSVILLFQVSCLKQAWGKSRKIWLFFFSPFLIRDKLQLHSNLMHDLSSNWKSLLMGGHWPSLCWSCQLENAPAVGSPEHLSPPQHPLCPDFHIWAAPAGQRQPKVWHR